MIIRKIVTKCNYFGYILVIMKIITFFIKNNWQKSFEIWEMYYLLVLNNKQKIKMKVANLKLLVLKRKDGY